MSPLFLAVFIAGWSLILGLAVPSLWQGQLAESVLVGTILPVGGITVLRHPRSSVSRWLGWAMLVEGVLFLHSAALLLPGLWGNTLGFRYLNYSSFVDAWVELMLALACIAVQERLRAVRLTADEDRLLGCAGPQGGWDGNSHAIAQLL